MFVCLFVRFEEAAEKDTTTVVGGGGFGFVFEFDCGLVLRLDSVWIWFVVFGLIRFGLGCVWL